MLSVKSLGAADSALAAYYENLAQDDYYQIGLEPAGRWFGGLADNLLVFGEVKQGQLGAMFEGKHPLTGEELSGNAGPHHKAGWDLTFSAPKSVSVIWAVVQEGERDRIAHAHDQAVAAAMKYIQKRAFSSRDRHGASRVDSILAAIFQHGSSRELDPQLHSHVLVANLAQRGDGSFSAIDFDSRYKMAAGAIYRAELAAKLIQFGYEVERDKKSFRLTCIDQSICDNFSKRRNQIVERLQTTGHVGAKAAGIAALATRQNKVAVARSGLHCAWRKEAAELGFMGVTVKEISLKAQQSGSVVDIDSILGTLTASFSTFTPMQLDAAIATESQGLLSAEQIESLIASTVSNRLMDPSKLGLVALHSNKRGQRRNMVLYTTREMLHLERDILLNAQARQNELRRQVSCSEILVSFPSLSAEQLSALAHITENPGAVKLIQGLAGTGKSYLLRAAKTAWEQSGHTLIGAALSGKAADSLEQGSGIYSQTLHSLLSELETGRRTLACSDVVVLDEAGMIGSRQMGRLLSHIHAADAKAVLVGDFKQLQPIDSGAIFHALSKRLGAATLNNIRRQEKADDRQMIHDVIAGKTSAALTSLKDRGLLCVAARSDLFNNMVVTWDQMRDPALPYETVMLAGTRADVHALNLLARETLKDQNRLCSEITIATEAGERQFAIGDRLVFTRNSRWIGVKNGQTGNLARWQVDERGDVQLTVDTDHGKSVSFTLGKYNHFDHGYALSVHKAQGQTVDNALVMLSHSMTDREWSYVAASRHRKELRVFVASEHIDVLEPLLHRSRQKDIALDYLPADEEITMELEG